MLDEYQEKAAQFSAYDEEHAIEYLTLGLVGEAGEVANEVKRMYRQGGFSDDEKVVDELGDVMWYLGQLAAVLGYSIEDIQNANIAKLNARHGRTVI
jgi:NTP pyrophosphatase (non-canonical NTP hydrolase)